LEATVERMDRPGPGNIDVTEDARAPSSRLAFESGGSLEEGQISTPERKLNIPAVNSSRGGFARAVGRLFMFLVFLAALGGAFYAGRRYKGPIPFLKEENEVGGQTSPNPVPAGDPLLKFEQTRREIDRDPNVWLTTKMKVDLTAQGVPSPLESADPEFLYLYGRALLLTGNGEEAARAFEQAIVKADIDPAPRNSTIRKEATLALAALAIKFDKEKPRALTHLEEMLAKPVPVSSP
jgi:hypothetical protein